MLCQKCGLAEATVHRESTVFRQKVEEHLCELCAGSGADVFRAVEVSRARRNLGKPDRTAAGNPGRVLAFLKSKSFPELMGRLFTEEERKKVMVEFSERRFRIHGDGALLERLFEALRDV